MKQLRIRTLGALLALLLLLSLCPAALAAENAKSGVITAQKYTMDIKLDTKTNHLSEKVTVKVKNGTKKKVKRLYFRNMADSVLRYDKKEYPNEANEKARSTVTSVKVKGGSKLEAHYEKDRSVFYVDLGKHAIGKGKTLSLTLRAETDIPNRQDRFGYQASKEGKHYALSFCFPALADYKDGKWNKDPYFDDGETRSGALSDYTVTFRAPKSYAVASVGSHKTRKGVTTIHAEKVRDFALLACNYMKKDSFKVNGIQVNNYYLSGRYQKRYRKLCKLVTRDAIQLFEKKVGKYPYKQLDIAPGLFGFAFGGMEYCGLILNNASSYAGKGTITAKYDPISLLQNLSHEIGHQWFYAAVGNDEYKEGWLDEGFTSYLECIVYGLEDTESLRYANSYAELKLNLKQMRRERSEMTQDALKGGETLYLNTPVSAYGPEDMYSEREYEGGCSFLCQLREVMGAKKFDRFLKDYYKRNTFRVATTSDVLKAIRRQDNGKGVNKLIKRYISKKYL